MKYTLLSLIVCLFLAHAVQAYTLYQVDIEESLAGICYGFPVRLQSFSDKSACVDESTTLSKAQEDRATINHPDRAATGQYQRQQNDSQTVEKKYFFLKDDEEFNRRLGTMFCKVSEIRENKAPDSQF